MEMDFTTLPIEIIETIISFLDIDAAKNMSLTSKNMYSLTLPRLWAKPNFTELKGADFLEEISKFPVGELHTRTFIDCSWMEVAYLVPQLKLLHIDQLDKVKIAPPSPFDSALRFLKVPVVLHTDALHLSTQEHFDDLLQIIKKIQVKELIIDHSRFDLFGR